MKKKFVCPICGFVYEGNEAPERCPQCKQIVKWNELDADADFDEGYCDMVRQMTAADVQQLARQLLKNGKRIEVTMLSE